ncbi:hypothetical protein HK096_005551 [Nowakowskiella sp. JEL0078]|nr:hypothetical protein HK096_005551 [Nowakowskiella sp. JEL0078]
MDHHVSQHSNSIENITNQYVKCPWMANCVGHHNHRYFYLFLANLTFACFYYCLMCIPIGYDMWRNVEVFGQLIHNNNNNNNNFMMGCLASMAIIVVETNFYICIPVNRSNDVCSGWPCRMAYIPDFNRTNNH